MIVQNEVLNYMIVGVITVGIVAFLLAPEHKPSSENRLSKVTKN